jgi:hypothetical protein
MRKTSQVNRLVKVCAGRQIMALGLFCAAVFLFAQPAEAQQFVYNDFSSPTGIQLNGSAAVTSNGTTQVLRLTPAALDQVGTAWSATTVPLAKGFSTTFRFQITAGTESSGDGFAFVIQNGSFCNGTGGNTANEGPFPVDCPSGEGGSLGYISLTKSVAIEFDTFAPQFGDLSNDEVGIQSCGAAANTPDHTVGVCNFGQVDLSVLPAPIHIADGLVHTATISYDPAGSSCGVESICNLFVTVDGQQVLSTAFNLATLGLDASDDAFVGFTAATGGLGGNDDNQDILSWTFDTSQTMTLGGTGTTTTYTFNTDSYKITPLDNTANGQPLTVTAFSVPKSLFPTFSSPPALNETCVPYGDYSTSVDTCVEFQTTYLASPFLYSLATGYDLPADLPAIGGPDFLVAHGQPCPLTPNSIVTSIFTDYEPAIKDPTTRGGSKGPSCFVATYTPGAPVITTGIGFKGWGAPVVNSDLNLVKAGATRPLQFQFFDNLGNPVLNLAYCNSPSTSMPGVCLAPSMTATPTTPWINFSPVPIPCSANAGVNTSSDLTVSAAGNSGLQNNGGGSYQLNWKTEKGLTGCANVQVTYSIGGAANVEQFPAILGFKFN